MQDARFVAASPGNVHPAESPRATILVVPAPAGVNALRRSGKSGVAAMLDRHLQDSGVAIPPAVDWQLLERLPEPAQPSSPQAREDGMPIVSELSLSSGQLTCLLRIPYDLPIFRGHFQHVPIVPGVVQVGWVVELATAHGLVEGEFTGITTVKFRRLVQPGMQLSARLLQDGDAGRLRFGFEVPGTLVTSGRLRFGVGRG